MNGTSDLLASYRQSLKSVLLGQKSTLERGSDVASDLERLREMESDLLYVLEWLTHEMEPGPRRGIERRSQAQRTVYLSEMQLEQVARHAAWHSAYPSEERSLPPQAQADLDYAMKQLSPCERRAFALIYGSCFSVRETAELMGVRQTTVKTLVLRARKKLAPFRETED